MLPKRQQIRKIGRKRAVNVAKKATFAGPGTIELNKHQIFRWGKHCKEYTKWRIAIYYLLWFAFFSNREKNIYSEDSRQHFRHWRWSFWIHLYLLESSSKNKCLWSLYTTSFFVKCGEQNGNSCGYHAMMNMLHVTKVRSILVMGLLKDIKIYIIKYYYQNIFSVSEKEWFVFFFSS